MFLLQRRVFYYEKKCIYLFKCSSICSDLKINKNSELDAAYVPHKVEKLNDNLNYFKPPIVSDKIYSLILPPPNITGNLHLGHALTVAIQDAIVRWKQMHGIETMWVPGLDHAGIATQVIVEKKLWREDKLTRHDIGRTKFEEKVWNWKSEKESAIENQLKKMGLAINYDQKFFTMDRQQARTVNEVFIKLHENGLIYRKNGMVNWSCALQSAISDIEVEHFEIDGPTKINVPGYIQPIEFGKMIYFAYKLCDQDEEIIVATTRPETIIGDVALAVHPNDSRYSNYIGKMVWNVFRQEAIPIIADDYADPNFGTGVVKITPAHDVNDFDVAKRHSLKSIEVFDQNGVVSFKNPIFSGLKRFDARTFAIKQLESANLLREIRNHKTTIPLCSRSKDVIEQYALPQWFLKSEEMAHRALTDVKEGNLTIEPEHFEKIWFNWLENIRDWCISRQLWWGHRIPAYQCYVDDNPSKKIWLAASSETKARKKASLNFNVPENHIQINQDSDVLDTWFSSSLLPFSAFGWQNDSEKLTKYYPLSLMETGHDILFFWVARMVMLGREITGRLPFSKVLLHGIICDSKGRKMSKSLGNVIAPEDVISGATLEALQKTSKRNESLGVISESEFKLATTQQEKMFPEGIPECGADALRFTLLSHNIKSYFINFDINECFANKLFCNKIWQATKFAKMWHERVGFGVATPNVDLSIMDDWILSRLSETIRIVENAFESNEFHVAPVALKNFLYHDFCDVYLETTKRGLRSSDGLIASGHCRTLIVCLDAGLRALAPFMPHLCQHLHLRLPLFEERSVAFPKASEYTKFNKRLESEVQEVLEVVRSIRRLKKMFNITNKHKYRVLVQTDDDFYLKFHQIIGDLSLCDQVLLSSQVVADNATLSLQRTIKDVLRNGVAIHLNISDDLRMCLQSDLPKLEARKKKLENELNKINRMISGKTYKVNVSPENQEIHSKKVALLEEKIARVTYIINNILV